MTYKTINIELNGKKIILSEKSTVADAAEKLNIPLKNTIAELNGEIIKKDNFYKTILKNGDKVELVRFVGGG